MLRDAAAIIGVANALAVALGYLLRRRLRSRRSANLEHIQQLEHENRLMDESMERIFGYNPGNRQGG